MPDINLAVRFVDDYRDKDPTTRDSSPGKVDGHRLILIGTQKERRLLKKFVWPTKNFIFVEEGTRNIWYKPSFNNAGVVAMGFSLKLLDNHPKAVPMEQYASYFLDKSDPVWLARNDFVLS